MLRFPQAFHDRTGPAALAGPRVLLLTYFFPPSPAVGGLRWQKFASYLDAAGIGLDVVTVHPDALAARDDARLEDLPRSTRVFGVAPPRLRVERVEQGLLDLRRRLRPPRRQPVSGNSPTAPGPAPIAAPRADSFSRADILAGRVPGSGWFRAYHAWLDLARIRAWADEAAALGRRLLQPGVHQLVASCGPPHPVHEGARRLAREAGVPLVIDLRDPWALVERLPAHIASPAWYRLSERGERAVTGAASLVILNTEAAAAAMRTRYPERAGDIIAITNGCDEDPVPPADRSRFLVAYAGSIYLDRDPRPLFQAARRVVDELQLTAAEFGMEFMGNAQSYRGLTLQAIAAEEGVGEYVRTHPARPRAEALAFLAGASVLLSLPQDSEMAIPSKIFEYFQFEAWVLALAEPGSATASLLDGTGADAVSARDVGGIAAALTRRVRAWRAGTRPPVLAREERFTRRFQAERLIAAMRPLLSPEPVESPCPR